jgi:7-cyano-7-deazaguanine reductase
MPKKTKSSTLGYTDEHAVAGLDAALPEIESWPNQFAGYEIEISSPEFTSVCPKTGQPDFGTITFTYTPGESCVELKSLKFYLQRFRDQGIFYEQVTNRLLDDFVAACKPVRCRVVSPWTPRGGITTNVTCSYEAGK